MFLRSVIKYDDFITSILRMQQVLYGEIEIMIETIETNKMAYSVEEVAEMTSLSKAFLRLEVRRGKLQIKKFGRRVLVLHSELQRYLNTGSNAAKTENN